jgi:D-inositol-3-phosphate glycosyltransferase
MKVLIVATFIPPHVGGLEVIVTQQAKSLAAMGHSVTVLTSHHDRDLAREEWIDGYRVIRTPTFNALERRTAVPFPLWGIRTIAPLLRLARAADVVHVHDVYYQPSLLGALAARWFRRPLFVTQHVSLVEHDSPVVMGVQRFVYATAGASLWRWCHGIVAYNVIVERFLADRKVAGKKVHLTYNGIDTAQFRPGTPAVRASVRAAYGLPLDKPLVLFVGRLVPKKGYRELAAAHHPDYHIVLVGPGPIPADVPPGVTFTGPIDRHDVLGLYQASDLFALPASGEMLTLAMQEAMACGLPIVATEDAAYDQYDLDPKGIAFVSATPAVLRQTFLDIVHDEERCARMRDYSLDLAATRFDWRANAADLADLYRVPGTAEDELRVDGSMPPRPKVGAVERPW